MLDGIVDTLLIELTDEQINQLIGDHWREIRGLLREKKRRMNCGQIEKEVGAG